MVYVALLRGINVGGNNKVDMKTLKTSFETLGHTDVITYINSGNIIFRSDNADVKQLETKLEKQIEDDFGLSIRVILRTLANISLVEKAIPISWTNDSTMKTDVMFLWEEVDSPRVLEQLTIKPDIDEVKYVNGAVIWRVDRDKVTRSGLLKIIGSDLYKLMTIRNVNTLRKIKRIMDEL